MVGPDPEALIKHSALDIVELAGSQGVEIMNWIAARGAMLGDGSIVLVGGLMDEADDAAGDMMECEANDEISLQLQWFIQAQFAGYYAAVDQGYYKDAGLDVEIVEAAPKQVSIPR